jgi:hypothetical protein
MGFIGQILDIRARGVESVHEKIVQVLKCSQQLQWVIGQEEKYEKELIIAQKRGDAAKVLELQREELKLVNMALRDIQHILVEIFALTDDEKTQIDKFVMESGVLLRQGINPKEEQQIMQRFQEEKRQISEFFKDTRMIAGWKR